MEAVRDLFGGEADVDHHRRGHLVDGGTLRQTGQRHRALSAQTGPLGRRPRRPELRRRHGLDRPGPFAQ